MFLTRQMEVEQLLQFIREKTVWRKWDAETCLRVGAELAVKVNGVSNLNGSEKKKLIVDLILRVLKEAEDKEKEGKSDTTQITERYDQLEKTVKDVLPTSLELIVSASRGKLDLKKVKPSVWMRYCSCFVKSVVTVLVSQKVISEADGKKVTDVTETVEEKAGAALDAVVASKEEGQTVENPVAVAAAAAAVALQIREVASTESSTQESKE
jgi:arginyl-tRNA synthetase